MFRRSIIKRLNDDLMIFRLLIIFMFILAASLVIFQGDFKNFYKPFYFKPSENNAFINKVSKESKSITDLPLKSLKTIPKPSPVVASSTQNISTPPPIKVIEETQKVRQSNLTLLGIIIWTNTKRIIAGLPQLKENEKLNQAALIKAQDIIENQYFAHNSPSSGAGPAELAKQVGYDFLAIGENLAMGNFEDDKAVVEAWMNSVGHRANILNPKYKEIGVAVLKGIYQGKEVWVAVQEFGRPVSDCPPVDENLKSAIESGKSEIEQLLTFLKVKKSEIENTSSVDSSLNQKVEEYNKLVEQYNSLINQLKEMIANYNNQVFLFNQCLY